MISMQADPLSSLGTWLSSAATASLHFWLTLGALVLVSLVLLIVCAVRPRSTR